MVYDWLKNKIPHPRYIKKKDNDDMLIVCGEDLSIYYLNKTAALFLRSVNDRDSIDVIKNRFLERFDVDEDVLKMDLVEIIRDLQWKKIIALGGV